MGTRQQNMAARAARRRLAVSLVAGGAATAAGIAAVGSLTGGKHADDPRPGPSAAASRVGPKVVDTTEFVRRCDFIVRAVIADAEVIGGPLAPDELGDVILTLTLNGRSASLKGTLPDTFLASAPVIARGASVAQAEYFIVGGSADLTPERPGETFLACLQNVKTPTGDTVQRLVSGYFVSEADGVSFAGGMFRLQNDAGFTPTTLLSQLSHATSRADSGRKQLSASATSWQIG